MSSHLFRSLVMTCCLSSATLAAEGTTFLDTRLDVRIRARTLEEAITELTPTQVTLAAAIAEDPALAVTDVRFREVPLRDALDALCTPRQLRWRVLDGQLVIDRPLGVDAEIRLRHAAQEALTARKPMAWAQVLDRIGSSGDLRAVTIAIDGVLSSDATIRQLTTNWLKFGWCCLFFDPAWGQGIGLCDDRAGLAHLLAVYRQADAEERPTLHRLLREARCRDAVPVLSEELTETIKKISAGGTDKQVDVAYSLFLLAGPAADDLLWEWWSTCIESDRAKRWPKYHKGDGSYLRWIGAELATRGVAVRRQAVETAWQAINTTGEPRNAWGSFADATTVEEHHATTSTAPANGGQLNADRPPLPTAPAAGSTDRQLWLPYYRALAENRSTAALDRLKQHALDGSPQHQAAMGTILAIPCPQANAVWGTTVERFETGTLTLDEILDMSRVHARGKQGASPRQLLPLLGQAITSHREATRVSAQQLIADWLGFPLNTKRAFGDLESVAEMADLLVASIPKNATVAQREKALEGVSVRGWLPAGSAVAYLTIHQRYHEPEEQR